MKKLVISLLAMGGALAGCTHASPPPIEVRLADFGTISEEELRKGRPLVIEIHEGEVLPLDVTVAGDLVASAPDTPPLTLVAKRTFWLRITREGLAISRDGKTFGIKPTAPGSFRAGIGATRERGVRGEIVITTPRP